MNTHEFAEKYLSSVYSESDIQALIQRRIQRWGIPCRDEVKIKTAATTRRSDLETWRCRIELKRELTYESLKSALGQLIIYHHYGSKLFGVLPKKRIIIGLEPTDPWESTTAKKLAKDIRGLGIEVVFLNEQPEWGKRPNINFEYAAYILAAIAAFGVAVVVAAH